MSDWKAEVEPILQAGAKKYFADDPKMSAGIVASPVARLVAALPFIAGCPKPDELAAKNVDTLIKEIKNPGPFAHRAGMSLRKRLAPGDNWKGAANPRAAEKGMLLLELASLQDHFRDREVDLASKTPNPLNEGMDYQKEKDRLVKAINAISSPEIDQITTADALIERSETGTVATLWM